MRSMGMNIRHTAEYSMNIRTLPDLCWRPHHVRLLMRRLRCIHSSC
jgi:hypothetical protein